ncbi:MULTISPECIES: sirohydrochlorin cobaltochelatase [Methanothrix]|jgi:sirohydrochlorin cobaltochelatase|uniref:Sirohydrochlorin cobaltochelatase cbik n=1 Tax=hydrocarbon metagenome TaxID=938273 RepID=A0A0W8FC26_9ZZZZ|nr:MULTISPECIES: sirohydrochlorin cobaltochelatase [Methanothrix]NYT10504.1 cobalt chelatase [Methanosarcinales archaeon]MBP7068772.1 sirohydrochlorin cobaltochelatase [Methanothrix sp.]MDD3552215.1 sirohydrochlorin cobaltochelatase [Methanothrix soehngenii]MDY0412804.1 sirohydrochlorin cobaltochelatase [Methanothrix soehngenii]UEC40403.1 MAG: Sirohydrochlorin cobaltochelatase CbiK [Methanothrix sp.]
MRKIALGLAALIAVAFVVPSYGAMDRPAKEDPAILLVVFGTSYPEAQAAYENIERVYREEFPQAEVRIAFTSDYIRRKLLDRDNVTIDNPLTALAHLNDEGYTDVVVQSLHVIPGEEFHDLANIVESVRGIEGKFGFRNLVLGEPLLMNFVDYRNVSRALASQFEQNTTGTERTPHSSPRDAGQMAVIYMGHGTEHSANSAYSQMANILAEDHENVFLGTVEGYPGYDEVLARLNESGVKKARLIPFMVVAGDHALNDLTGNESESWKSMLEKEGFEIDYNLLGMGENDGIVEIFVGHTKEAFAKFK